MEFLDGVFTHLALVDNPRYEKALVVLNSKTEKVNAQTKRNEMQTINNGWVTMKDKEGEPYHVNIDEETDKKTDKPENKTEDKKRTKLDVEKDLKDLQQKIQQFRSKGDLTEYQKMKKKYEELLEEYRLFTSVKKPEEKKEPQQLKLLNSIIAEALTEAITENCLGE